MKFIAFLKVLNPEETKLAIEKIHENILRKACFDEIKSFEEYTPKGYDHRFVVWCNSENERLSDEEAIKYVKTNGDILYFWTCPCCSETVCRYEFPGNHYEDCVFKCHCDEGLHDSNLRVSRKSKEEPMKRIAFLKVLNQENEIPNLKEIHKLIKEMGFDEVRNFSEYSPNGLFHIFVVWRYNSTDILSDMEIINLVGATGQVAYFSKCTVCKKIEARYECPSDHSIDWTKHCHCK